MGTEVFALYFWVFRVFHQPLKKLSKESLFNNDKGYKKIAASVHPENEKMHNLLRKFNFDFQGEYDDDEMVFRRTEK